MRYLLSAVFMLMLASGVFSQDFYDIETINTIELEFDTPYWDRILDSLFAAGEGERLIGNVVINGVQFDSVGVRYKGFSSYDPDNIKNPMNIKLDYVIGNQSLDGYICLKISNNSFDPTFLREVITYEITRNYTPASKANYANVYINGDLMGLYINVQAVDEYFNQDQFYDDDRAYFKGELGYGAAAMTDVWQYYGPDSSRYYDYYEIKSEYGWGELIEFLDVFNNTPENMEEVLDVDRTLWFIALHNLTVHLDSPLVWGRNYYTCQDVNGRFNPVPWDINMGFGGFNMVPGLGFLSLADMQQLDPFFQMNFENNAMVNKVLTVSTYNRMYVAHMKTMLDENFSGTDFLDRALEIQSIIDASVIADTNKFYSYEDYQRNVVSSIGFGPFATVGLTELMDARAEFVLNHRAFLALPPAIGEVSYSPLAVEPSSTVWFNVEAPEASMVLLGYRLNNTDRFERTEMYDDGLHNDGEADDGIYGVSVTAGYSDLEYYIYGENEEAGMFSPERAESEFYTVPISGNLFINEFMADNEAAIADPQGEYEDWIEIFNGSEDQIGLADYYLTDDWSLRDKWAFPDTMIEAGGFLMVWADEDSGDAGLHASFRLNREGEQIGLYLIENETMFVVDEIEFGLQLEDVSYGRYPDGSENWESLAPSPGWENFLSFAEPGGDNSPSGFSLTSIYPNPFNQRSVVSFTLEQAGEVRLTVFDITGREVRVLHATPLQAGNHEVVWDAEGIASGIYFVRLDILQSAETLQHIVRKVALVK